MLTALLQVVEGLVEPSHQLRVCGVNEANRLRVESVPWRKAFLMSSWCTGQSLEIARVGTV
jgi:hypothetical protein